jgi:hypothetical protein
VIKYLTEIKSKHIYENKFDFNAQETRCFKTAQIVYSLTVGDDVIAISNADCTLNVAMCGSNILQ